MHTQSRNAAARTVLILGRRENQRMSFTKRCREIAIFRNSIVSRNSSGHHADGGVCCILRVCACIRTRMSSLATALTELRGGILP